MRAFVKRKNTSGSVSRIFGGWSAAEVQLWVLGIALRAERGCGHPELSACVVCFAAVCLYIAAQLHATDALD